MLIIRVSNLPEREAVVKLSLCYVNGLIVFLIKFSGFAFWSFSSSYVKKVMPH